MTPPRATSKESSPTFTSPAPTASLPEFVGRAWDLDADDVNKFVKSETGSGIVKVKEGFKMPTPSMEDRKGMTLNCEEARLGVDIPNAGRVVVLNTQNLPLIKEVGLGADLVRIEAHSMCSPGFSCLCLPSHLYH